MGKESKKKLGNMIFFFLVMGLSFYAVFHGQDLQKIGESMRHLPVLCIGGAVLNALFFVSAEGCMIYYLLRSMDGKGKFWRCISYSFIGFFYSGITPSATGGQPMQLYHMKKDGHSLSDSSVVLMTVALIYKLVLVIMGIGILIFWNDSLRLYLQKYYGLYLLGLALNTTLVVLLLLVMLAPGWMKGIISSVEQLLILVKILKPSEIRQEKIHGFIDGYQAAVGFLLSHKSKICAVILFTFLQRISVFFLPYIVYLGFGLEGADLMTVVFLQTSVYIAVDMLPVPGSQGITELMYCNVFQKIFTGGYLMPSLYVTRGISFYFLLLVSLVVIIRNHPGRSGCGQNCYQI